MDFGKKDESFPVHSSVMDVWIIHQHLCIILKGPPGGHRGVTIHSTWYSATNNEHVVARGGCHFESSQNK